MRKLPLLPILIFSTLLTATVVASYFIARLSDSVILGVLSAVVISVLVYRLLALMYPVSDEGYTEQNLPLSYEVQLLYDLTIFLVFSHINIIPVPLTRLYVRMLGLKIGKNSYPGFAEISSPFHFVTIGDDVIFGDGAVITPHSYESHGRVLALPISIGNNVTIGMNSVVLPGVKIEDDAVVAAGAVVTKGTYIRKGEIWGGIPARKLKDTAVVE